MGWARRPGRRGLRLLLAIAVIAAVAAPSPSRGTDATADVAVRCVRTDPRQPIPVPLLPLAGDIISEARAINAAGEVAGWSRGADHEAAVVWDVHGRPRELASPSGHHRSHAYAINALGEVAGDSHGAGTIGVMWEASGRPLLLVPLPGHAESFARAINDAGQVVGYSRGRGARGVVLKSVVWEGPARSSGGEPFRVPTPLPLPDGAVDAAAAGINAHGRVVGFAFTDSRDTAVLWDPGAGPAALAARSPDEIGSEAHAINARGVIAGEISHVEREDTGVVWGGRPRALRLPAGYDHHLALAINDLGQVAGRSSGPSGTTAVAWGARGGATILPPLPGDTESQAFAINAAGSVAGVSIGESDHIAVVWHLRRCPP
jgi:uncharacterized membrane protein